MTAREEGYEEGYQEGFFRGYEKARKDFLEKVENLECGSNGR